MKNLNNLVKMCEKEMSMAHEHMKDNLFLNNISKKN